MLRKVKPTHFKVRTIIKQVLNTIPSLMIVRLLTGSWKDFGIRKVKEKEKEKDLSVHANFMDRTKQKPTRVKIEEQSLEQ